MTASIVVWYLDGMLNDTNPDFALFMTRVDAALNAILAGMADSNDIPDYDYYNAFEAGTDPGEVARDAIRNAADLFGMDLDDLDFLD